MNRGSAIAWSAARVVLFWGIVALAAYSGIKLRLWFYPASEPYRFHGDINNAWDQGSAVFVDGVMLQNDRAPLRWRAFWRGYIGRYDKVMSQEPGGRYDLDYPPARLLIMSIWAWHERSTHVSFFFEPAKNAGPLLWIDTIAESSAAVLVFFIVRLVLRRDAIRNAAWPALLAGLLLWFDPSVLLDRVWPQWDAWVLPFYLLAAYLALHRKWLAAGACLGVGMMFKGQILCTMAVFVLWPLFQMRWRAVLEVIIGILFGAMICTRPWLVRTTGGWISFIVLLIGAGAGVYSVPRRWRVLCATASIAVSILLVGICFGGSFAWWNVPFEYGSRHFLTLCTGTPTNLPILLSRVWQWRLEDVVLGSAVTMRVVLIALYSTLLVACALGLARNDLRNDRHVLIALATPWVLMFAFMPQMHERYLYWGAALTALAAGVSVGATLLHVVLTFLSCVAMGTWLTRNDEWQELTNFLRGMYPGIAWGVVFLALIFLYLSVIPARSKPMRV